MSQQHNNSVGMPGKGDEDELEYWNDPGSQDIGMTLMIEVSTMRPASPNVSAASSNLVLVTGPGPDH